MSVLSICFNLIFVFIILHGWQYVDRSLNYTTMLPFHYQRSLPSPDVAEFVKYFDIFNWHAPVGKQVLHLPPSGNPHINICFKGKLINTENTGRELILPENMLCGQTVRNEKVYHFGLGQIGIHFKPEKLHILLREDMSQFTDTVVDLSDLFEKVSKELVEGLVNAESYDEMFEHAETSVRKLMPDKSCIENSLVQNAITLIDLYPHRSIDEVCSELRVSSRHLRRVFSEKIGVGPKFYQRIKRVQKAAALTVSKETIDFHQIAFQCGYYDQSHFSRDIKLFMGRKPLEIFKKKVDSFLFVELMNIKESIK